MSAVKQRLMRWLKGTAVFTAALVALLALLALLVPGHWHADRAVLVHAPAAVVYPPVAELAQWPQWTVWYARTPPPETRYTGPASGVGAVSEWRDARGRGRLTVTAAEPERGTAYDLLFDGDMCDTQTMMTTRSGSRQSDSPCPPTCFMLPILKQVRSHHDS